MQKVRLPLGNPRDAPRCTEPVSLSKRTATRFHWNDAFLYTLRLGEQLPVFDMIVSHKHLHFNFPLRIQGLEALCPLYGPLSLSSFIHHLFPKEHLELPLLLAWY